MLPYMIAGISCLLFFYEPLVRLVSPGSRRIARTQRPAINESLLAIDGDGEAVVRCPPDSYSVHILSKAPLVMYMEDFIRAEERERLLKISEPIFEPSTITDDGKTTRRNVSIRDSDVALLPRDDTVRCIERRARALQGWRQDLWIERVRTQRYRAGQHYAHHFDWGNGRAGAGWGRVSSMLAWVSAEGGVEGGGTEFPFVRRNEAGRWCEWIECSEAVRDGDDDGHGDGDGDGDRNRIGVTFKPVPGNAIFWENFRPDGSGRGWRETWHAGLPVRDGVKVGLNIWSWGRLD